jgi:hypothetical protein
MLITAATATAVATASGLAGGAGGAADAARRMPPAATMARVALALAGAVIAARLVPGHGKVVGIAVVALVGIAYLAILIVTREFGPEDRAKFAKVFKR